jgi:hypothetical protein
MFTYICEENLKFLVKLGLLTAQQSEEEEDDDANGDEDC